MEQNIVVSLIKIILEFGFEMFINAKEGRTPNTQINHPYACTPVHPCYAFFLPDGCHDLSCGSLLSHESCFDDIEWSHDKSCKRSRD